MSGSPVVKIQCSQCRGHRFDPCQGPKILPNGRRPKREREREEPSSVFSEKCRHNLGKGDTFNLPVE